MVHCVKELRDVHVHNKVYRTFHDDLIYLFKSIVTAPIWTKTVRHILKILFKDRFENLLYRHLDDFVFDSRDSEWSFIAVWLWDMLLKL